MLFTDAIKLLPGFRFRPTDEELVSYYLKRKVSGRILPLEVIAEIDLYKYEPWDLPEKSALPSRDLEWYFFIPRDKKYPNGSRANRATAKGYWKSTGKDRSVSSSSRGVGTKKTLVYYNGRAPRGERTNWVMHEYRLNDIECQRIHAEENGFVLCRIYQKSGLGPKNGEQYGAPVEDDDFEDSPMAEVDGGGPLKPKLPWRRPISPNTFLEGSCATECDDDCVSFGINMDGQQQSCLVFEPRDLNMHFEKQYGEVQQKGVGNFTCCTSDDVVSAANGKIVELTVAAPVTLEDEAEILEQLLGECIDQLKSTNSHQINPMAAEDGCHQVEAQLPRDGDFLELNDLSSLSDSKDSNNFVKENEKNATIRLKDYADEGQDSLMQAFPTFDSMAGWEMFLSEEVQCEGEQVMPKVVEMQSTLSTVSHDSQHQPLTKDTFESFSAPPVDHTVDTRPAGPTQHIESVDENSLKMLNRLNAYVSEKDIFRGLLESEGNSELLMQEGFYFDAVPLFPDVDVCEEFSNTNLEGLNDYAMPQVTLENKGDEPLADRISNVKDDDGSSQGQAVCLEGGRRSPRSLSLFLRFMDSLPTLPASAAELTPKTTSPRSAIHVTATGIAVNSVSVTCTCIGTCVPSSCVNCSLTKAEKKGRFVRSVSFVGQREVSLKRWDTGISISAVFWGILAIFIWVFVAARVWKAWGTSMQAECIG